MNIRYSSAAKYLEFLEDSFTAGWHRTYEGRNAPGAGVFKKLALLHPLHLEELALPGYTSLETEQKRVQGPRSFGISGLSRSCQSKLLWGYVCPLKGSELQQDHLFPYSLGGPTDGANRVALCRYHNMVKTCDIHCFPWEEVDVRCGPWLDRQIQKLFDGVFSR